MTYQVILFNMRKVLIEIEFTQTSVKPWEVAVSAAYEVVRDIVSGL